MKATQKIFVCFPSKKPLKPAKKRVLMIITACILAASSLVYAAKQPAAFDVIGLYKIRSLEPDLMGTDINIALVSRAYTYADNDYTPDLFHNSLFGSKIELFDDGTGADICPHATAIASILTGFEPNVTLPEIGTFDYEGALPFAQLNIYEFRYFVKNIVFPNTINNTDIISMSLGSQFQDWWTNGINRLAEKTGTMIVAGIGNGFSVNDPPLYPAAGTNVLGVGVVSSIDTGDLATSLTNFTDPNAENSSVGPTADGRCKPDIVAPANCLAAYSDALLPYKTTGDWSSFSAPVAAGTIGMLIEKAKSDPNLAASLGETSNCVFKAIVMNSAKKLPGWHKGLPDADDDHTAPLDFVQGAGMLDAFAAYKLLLAGQADANELQPAAWDNSIVTASAPSAYFLKTDPSAAYITATLVWNKHYQANYPFAPLPEKDADLRLELWGIGSDPSKDQLLDYSDSAVDNVEHIYFAADPNYSMYTLVVSFNQPLTSDDTEHYGIAYNVTETPPQEITISLPYLLNPESLINTNWNTLLEKLSSVILK